MFFATLYQILDLSFHVEWNILQNEAKPTKTFPSNGIEIDKKSYSYYIQVIIGCKFCPPESVQFIGRGLTFGTTNAGDCTELDDGLAAAVRVLIPQSC